MRAPAIALVVAASAMLGAAAPAPVPLLSFRAQYEVTLPPGGTSREIAGVRGRMVTEFRQSCGGYAETQRFVADMTDVDENTSRTDYSASTWESGDGNSFEFTVADAIVGRAAERFAGHATAASSGEGKAVFTAPAGGTLALPKGTLFPTEFSVRLIAAARAGQTSFSATVFQGDDAKQLNVASAFIGHEVTAPDAELANIDAVRGVRSWPMIISYYALGSADSTPDYEMTFRGYENGVATGLQMRYPHFALAGHLVKLEVLPAVCDPSSGHSGGAHE